MRTIILVGCLLMGAIPAAHAVEVRPVASLEDLRLQPEIRLEGGIAVRLGLESGTSLGGSGVLVYCLASASATAEVSGLTSLGPLDVALVPRGEQARAPFRVGYASPRRVGRETLFSTLVATPAIGSFDVAFLCGAEVVALGRLEVPDVDSHPWDAGCAQYRRVDRGPRWLLSTREAPRDMLPAAAWGGLDDPSDLPRFRTLRPGGLTVSVEGHRLRVASRVPFCDRAGHHFYIRIRVNGEPVVRARREPWGSSSGMHGPARELDLVLALDGERLGARPGDEVRLQILYAGGSCTHGGMTTAFLLSGEVVVPLGEE